MAGVLVLPVVNRELDICIGLVTASLALVCVVTPLEWGLRGERSGKATDHRRGLLDRAVGAILTVMAVLFTLGVCREWVTDDRERVVSPPPMARQEQLAVQRLRVIARAQAEYIRSDWDGDGSGAYAEFLPHLWQSVRASDSSPVPVKLIPYRLAIARPVSHAVDGYIFFNLHQKGSADDEEGRTFLDYAREWAAVAYPVAPGTRNAHDIRRVFLLDSSGALRQRSLSRGKPSVYPPDAREEGWEIAGE